MGGRNNLKQYLIILFHYLSLVAWKIMKDTNYLQFNNV